MALAGLMNVLTALFPAFHWRYLLLRDMVPVRLINDSDIAAVLLGLVLIVLADGLLKRHRRAMWMTLTLLVASAIVHLTKGLDYEEALICLAIASILFARRKDYVVASRPIGTRRAIGLTVCFGLLYYSYDLLGFRILSAWIRPHPTFMGALEEPWRYVANVPIYHYHGYQAHWFGTSLVLIGSIALVASAILLLRPLLPIHRSNAADRTYAHSIVRSYGRDTLSYFALRDDRTYFFDDTKSAFLSYKVWRNVALVGGDPIGPPQFLSPLMEQFLQFCESNALLPCFLGANQQQLPLYRSLGLRVLKIGEESVIRLATFDVARLKRKVRRGERHCIDLGISVGMFQASDLPQTYREQASRFRKGG